LTFGFGKNTKHKFTINIIMIDIKNGILDQIGFLKGLETLNAIAVTTY
jgi:hypothetical protein